LDVVNELQLLTAEELFLTIDESSLLGKELVAFTLKIIECKDNVRTLKEDIETLGTQESDLAAQIETLNEQNPLLQQNTALIEQLIAVNTKHIAAESEKVLTITGISMAHCAMRMKFSYVKSKGSETFDTITSQLQSVDHNRIDLTKRPSPSDSRQLSSHDQRRL
jgi:septal ring factor EnvC (AmiA/AmiB activator)